MAKVNLFRKYDVQAPRYTSYPTVPYWTRSPSTQTWEESLALGLKDPKSSWSLYIHIPYCETLCTFCGCNTVITRNHRRETPYVQNILKEWKLYGQRVPNLHCRPLKQLHLGGGTPTFLSQESLYNMIAPLLEDVDKDPKAFEASIEVDPRRTRRSQLSVLYDLGFRRVSLGVQDFNEHVQKWVNRIQPFSVTKEVTETARQLGYESINFDLIYGLPQQDLSSMKKTIELTLTLVPDRIALYSLAVVPWIKPAQRLFKEEHLPQGEAKRRLYELAREKLLKAGYRDVGLDHFALPTDNLYKAHMEKKLHRNFMGYTDLRTNVLLGLGVSAISESPSCFHQNQKVLPVYERFLQEKKIPTLRGHHLSEEEKLHREQILTFMTMFQVELDSEMRKKEVEFFLSSMVEDGLVVFEGLKMKLTQAGLPFLRNACMGLDKRLREKAPQSSLFSKTL